MEATSAALGVIADDYTGAVDVAGVLRERGAAVNLHFGVPADEAAGAPQPDGGAVVVALKTRSVPPDVAVAQALAAARWLRARGARQLFFKYSSTFDSTDAGNIGPVMDALYDETGLAHSPGPVAPVLACPAVPGYGRTVYQGHLFVGDRLVAESPAGRHPLTPKTDSDLVRLLSRQTAAVVGLLPRQVTAGGEAAVAGALAAMGRAGVRYAVADAVDDRDLAVLGAAARGHPLVTGAAGLAAALVGHLPPALGAGEPPAGLPAAVVSGSGTEATLEQVRRFSRLRPTFRVVPGAIARGDDVVAEALAFARRHLPTGPVLVSATAPPEAVRAEQQALGAERAARLVETALAEIAAGLVSLGVRALVVAGGETSGAVVGRCGVDHVVIGREVAPGVSWARTAGPDPLWLLLKSGPLGAPDLFAEALPGRAGTGGVPGGGMPAAAVPARGAGR
ncbi:3-oxo-tetronate kinase [Georgenia sp. SYP-B2076]|uniref:3-oxo-tetronate kinase n=1 Tax=Georgenia sp. SYP-B2076 TaxID=2495881 RepID=UPI000F8C4B4B|nr:3-oxo-tetronate kinase [Georgenia sp. SYP-B2076]